MFFRATKEVKRKKHILFIDASKRFGKGKAQNFLTDEDVEDIFAVYQSMDLNIGRYLKADAAEVVDVQDALASFDQARTELAVAEKALLAKLKAAGYA